MPPPQLPKVGKNLYNQGLGKGANSGGRVSQPESIVCYVCRREKPQTQFSGRQLAKHKGTIYQPFTTGAKGKPQHRTTCKTCTADQTTELTCIVCGETNGLDHFAKTQRKNPDTARCKNCINKQANIAPDLEMPDSDDDASSDDEEDEADFDTGNKEDRSTNTVLRAGTTYAGSSIHTNTLTSANLNRLEQATGSVITPHPGAVQAADGWVTKTRQPLPQQQIQSETMTTMTYDSAPRNANGTQVPSSVSNTETFDSRAPLRSVPPKGAGAELRKNGWARVAKAPKKGQNANGFGSDDGYDDAKGSVVSGGSEWTDRKKTVRTDFDDDPWSRHYK
ncbi:hypothetical protein TWF506_003952 [Arthrobotrys conoides]|uniref:Stc1 domain-containing protein n=1 Tax=Arthrobotrys conoides TaxID=74498 RepID=A0AAN8P4I6_9PEZI